MWQAILAAVLSIAVLAGSALAGPEVSPRPAPRKAAPVTQATTTKDAAFAAWIAAFRPRALAQGITPATFDRAFRGVRLDAAALRRDATQAEFTKPLWDYLDTAVSAARVADGKAALAKHHRTLERIEAKYGVRKEIIVAIWGLESAYGGFRGKTPLIASMATLAHASTRAAFFEGELIAALRIVQSGVVAPERLVGSWAGGMGHTQFIPTSYLAHAVDHTGDGRRDIWGDDPTDALASTAAYLAHHGWTKGQPWAVEVTLPRGFDYALSGKGVQKSAAAWAALGVTRAGGGRLADHGPASILLPAGARGVALMIFHNFAVIRAYNMADAYVIGVGHLADRIAGRPAFRAPWPRKDRTLGAKERVELQQRLIRAGFLTGAVDGKIGPRTVAAVQAFQRARGLTPDGYATMDLLARLQ